MKTPAAAACAVTRSVAGRGGFEQNPRTGELAGCNEALG
jgi:hypothetical protein